jgi:gamma-butyrobetaine dioxygenase
MTAPSTTPTSPVPAAALLRDLPVFWLRDNCDCASCRDPRNGQKLFQITDLPADLAIGSESAVLHDGRTVHEVSWTPDGHRSRYSQDWLDAVGEPDHEGDGRTEDAKRLWSAADFSEGGLPQAAWEDYLREDGERLHVLDSVARLGFALLRGVPQREGQVLAVAESFGFVRETNYGRLFDVRVENSPNNLAFTSAAIAPHTDNPYRDPVPTLQLLHCLDNSAPGGDSGLVDGFAAAALLRAQDPAAFDVLARTPVPFRFQDADTCLRAEQPLIGLDPRGRIREVRFNNRSTGTLRLPADQTTAFYAAYRAFGALLLRPDLRLDFRLTPGDCLIFDNVRLLHSRTAFQARGSRHLQGCYADLDALASTRAVLRDAAERTGTAR